MKKVRVEKIDNYDYTLIDFNNNVYEKNIEFYSNFKPMVGDIIYISENILNEVNLYAFDEIYVPSNVDINDIIKVVHDNKEYYFQRIYG